MLRCVWGGGGGNSQVPSASWMDPRRTWECAFAAMVDSGALVTWGDPKCTRRQPQTMFISVVP